MKIKNTLSTPSAFFNFKLKIAAFENNKPDLILKLVIFLFRIDTNLHR